MALEEQGMSSFMRSGMFSLMGLFEIIPALQEIRLEKKYNEEKNAREKAAFHPEVIARYGQRNPMGLLWANQDTIDLFRQRLIAKGIPFVIVSAAQIKSPDIHPGGPFVFVVRDIDQERAAKILQDIIKELEQNQEQDGQEQEEEEDREEDYERERTTEDGTGPSDEEEKKPDQEGSEEEPPVPDDTEESQDDKAKKEKKKTAKQKPKPKPRQQKRSYQDSHVITQEQIRRQMDDIRQLEIERRALDRERLLQQETADYYKKRSELKELERESRRRDEAAHEQRIKELERRVEEHRKITEARNDKFSSQGYTGWRDFAADAQEKVRRSSDDELKNGACYHDLAADDYLKKQGSGETASYRAYTQEERTQHLDQKYGAGSETKIQLNGYARDREALEVAREREEIARARDRYAEAVREKRTDDAKRYDAEYRQACERNRVDAEKAKTWNTEKLRVERERLEKSVQTRSEYLEQHKVSGYREYGEKVAECVRTAGVEAYTAGQSYPMPEPERITDASGHQLHDFQKDVYNAKRQENRATEKDWVTKEDRLKPQQTYQKVERQAIYGTTVMPGSEAHRKISSGTAYTMTWKQVQSTVNAEAARAAMENPDVIIRQRNPQYGGMIATSVNAYNNQTAYRFERDRGTSSSGASLAPDTPVTQKNTVPQAGGAFHVTPGMEPVRPQSLQDRHESNGEIASHPQGRSVQKKDYLDILKIRSVAENGSKAEVLEKDMYKVRARNQLAKAINSRYFTMAVASGVGYMFRSTYEGTEAAPTIDKLESAVHFGSVIAKQKIMQTGIRALEEENVIVQSSKNAILEARTNMAMRMDKEELKKYADQLNISAKQLEKAQTDVHKMETLLELSMANRNMTKDDMLEMAHAFGIAGSLAKDGMFTTKDGADFLTKMNSGMITSAQQARALESTMASMDFTTAATSAEALLKAKGDLDAETFKNMLKQHGFTDESIKNLEGKWGDKDALLKAVQAECAGKQAMAKALLGGNLDPTTLRELLTKNGVSQDLIDKLGKNWAKQADVLEALSGLGMSKADMARLAGAFKDIQLQDASAAFGMMLELNGGRVTTEFLQMFEDNGLLTEELSAFLAAGGRLEDIKLEDLKKMIPVGDPNTIAEMISKGSMQCAVKQRIQDASGASFKFSLFGLARHLRSMFLKLGKSTDAANGFNMVTSYASRMYMITKISYRLLYNGLFKHLHKMGIGPIKLIDENVLAHPMKALTNKMTGGMTHRMASVFSKPLHRLTHNRAARLANHVMHPGRTTYTLINKLFIKIFHKSLGQTLLGRVVKQAAVKIASFISSGALATICFWIVVIIIALAIYEGIDTDSGDSATSSYSAAYVSAADGKDAFAQEVIDMLRGYTDDFIDEINNAKYNRGMYSTMIDYNTNESVGNYENGAYRIVFRGPDGEPIENIRDVDLNNSKDIISMASVFIPTVFNKPDEDATSEQKEAYEKDKEHFKDYCSFLWAASHQISIEEYHPGNATNEDADDTSGLETDATTGKCKMDYAMFGDQGAGVNWWLGTGMSTSTYKQCKAEANVANGISYEDTDYETPHTCVEKPLADPCTHGHWITENVAYVHQACRGHHRRDDSDYTCAEVGKDPWCVHDNVYRRIWVCDGHMGAVVYVTIGKISRMPNFGAATDWDFSSAESFGGYGSGGYGIGINGTEEPFTAQGYPELTDQQLNYLAGMCVSEQGAAATNPVTMRYQASLMANVYELYAKRKGLTIWQYLSLPGGKGGSAINGVRGWFAKTSHDRAWTNSRAVSDECKEAIRDVLVNGNRITHANEQGTLKSGFVKAVYNGQTYTGDDLLRSEIWVPGETLIYTSGGQECIFLAMPGGAPGQVDPFALIKN